MPLSQIDQSGAVRAINALSQVDAGGVVRSLQELWQVDAGGTPRLIFTVGGQIQLNPNTASGTASSRNATRVPTNNITVSLASGGAITSTTWTVPDGWSVSNPGQTTTSFVSPSLGPNTDVSDTGSVTVKSGGGTYSADFPLIASNQSYQ